LITIVYPYRNRDLKRIEYSLNSLKTQSNSSFLIIFIDYGSDFILAKQVKDLVEGYDFASYYYAYNHYQPWNKSKALNFALNITKTPYFFVADVDVIFHPEFVQKALDLTKINPNNYFKVGFLSEEESKHEKSFQDYKIKFESTDGATGLSVFNTQDLITINGFDEYYHFWGAEDTDVHVRLQNNGKTVRFFDNKILLLHQWHQTYRQAEETYLTNSLMVKGIVQQNQGYLAQVKQQNKVRANTKPIGQVMDKTVFDALESMTNPLLILNNKAAFDAWFYGVLCNLDTDQYCVFKIDPFCKSRTYYLKKALGKKVPEYYDLKEINDKLLSYLTAALHTKPYTYKVSDNLDAITLKIKA